MALLRSERYSVHLEAVRDYRYPDDREPVGWVIRGYVGDDPEYQFWHYGRYELSVFAQVVEESVCELKGLDRPVNKEMFKLVLAALRAQGIKQVQIRRHGRLKLLGT